MRNTNIYFHLIFIHFLKDIKEYRKLSEEHMDSFSELQQRLIKRHPLYILYLVLWAGSASPKVCSLISSICNLGTFKVRNYLFYIKLLELDFLSMNLYNCSWITTLTTTTPGDNTIIHWKKKHFPFICPKLHAMQRRCEMSCQGIL